MLPPATSSQEDGAANGGAPSSSNPPSEFCDSEYLSYEECDDDGDEYEEIEIEEEVDVEEEYDDEEAEGEEEEEAEDVEEEVEVEEECDDDEEEEEEEAEDVEEDEVMQISETETPEKDISQDVASEREPGSHPTPESSALSPPPNSLVEDCVSSKTLVPETTDICRMMGGNAAIPLSMRNSLGDEANTFMCSRQEVKSMAMHSNGSNKQPTSRLAASEARTRSISPSAELRDGNKRPAVICDFFAKGWCIKGSTCRFLHINDKADDTSRLLKEHGKRLCPLDDQHKISSLQKDELSWGLSCDPKQKPSPIDFPGGSSSFMDVGRESHLQNWIATDYGNCAALNNRTKTPFSQNSFPPELQTSLSGSIIRSINYCSSAKASLNPSRLDDMGYMRSAHCSSGDASLSRSNMRTSFNPSAWTGSLFSLKPFDRSPLRSQKLVDSGRGDRGSRSSSSMQISSPSSGAEAENPPPTSLCGGQLHFAKDEVKISSNAWEPSKPFRPSFFINPAMTSFPGCQYGHIQDSFNLSILGDKASTYPSTQRTPVLNKLHQQVFSNLLLSSATGTECNGEKSTVSSHNEVVPNEESVSGTDHDKETPISYRRHANDNASHKSDGPRHTKDMRRDWIRQNNEIEVDQKTDADVQKESRALRCFRTALIDFVKELLKPAWREGKLSKGAHNAIVKKSVEKVLTTLQLHQIPTTEELTKLYLSSSQPNLSKLVKGYITKYGMS